jgi:type II secretory pathway pseudopilin PulG
MLAHTLSKRRAFSVIDLVVVLAMAGILLGLVLPAVHSAQVAGLKRETVNNLKQICLALHNANDAHKKLPPAFDKFGNTATLNLPASLHVHLLPYIEQDTLYRAYLKEKGKGDVAKAKVPQFISSDDPSARKKDLSGIMNYAANLRVFSRKGMNTKYDANMPALAAIEPGEASIPATFPDGTSNTIVYATVYAFCGDDGGSQYASAPNSKTAAFFGQNAAKVKAHPSNKTATFQLRPEVKDCCVSPLMAQSFTKAGLLIGMADGSTRSASPNLSPQTWNAAVHPADGMPLGADWE